MRIDDDEVERSLARERAEMKRREQLYRSGRPALLIEGRTALLIDDGLVTGNSIIAAVRHTRGLSPAKIIVGVPVGSLQACARLHNEVDLVILSGYSRFLPNGGRVVPKFRAGE